MTEIARQVHGAAAGVGKPLPEVIAEVEEYASQGMNAYDMAPFLGVTPQGVYEQFKRYPELAEAYGRARAKYQLRLMKPINYVVDNYDDESLTRLAVDAAFKVLGRRYQGWQDKATIQYDGAVEVQGTVEHVPAEAWSTHKQIAELYRMAKELGLDQMFAQETAAAEPLPQPEPPTAEDAYKQREREHALAVYEQRPLPAEDKCRGKHVAAKENRFLCVNCEHTFAYPLWVEN
jgi:hypothetical protein